MKIVYCLNSIKGIGGIQNVTITKANALAEIKSNEVFVIVTDNQNNLQCGELSDKVKFIHLNINYYDDDWIEGFRTKISQLKKRRLHKIKLKNLLNELKPDVIISVGQSEKFICRKGLLKSCNPIYIRELHFVTHFRNVLAKSYFENLKANFHNFIDFKILCRIFYDAVIPLTPIDLEKNWKNNKHAYFVPNPVTIDDNVKFQDKLDLITNKEKKIIAVGRLTYIKNFKSLINAFSLIAEEFKDWRLEIFGEGEDFEMLNNFIINKNLTNQVFLKGFSNKVGEEMKKSSILGLTSIMEGFPLVLFEAMNFGNVIVSYNCDFGPSFIVDDCINGYLIENSNEVLFAEKLRILMQDENLRNKMAYNAIEKSENFSSKIIADKWMELFRILKEAK